MKIEYNNGYKWWCFRYKPHEKRYENDIALIRVKKDIEFSQNVAPICLPKGNRFPDTSGVVYVAGWGLLHDDECTTNDKVKKWINVLKNIPHRSILGLDGVNIKST